MARLRKKGTGWSVRLRYGEGQDSWFDLNVDADAPDVAEDRRKRLQRLANLLNKAGKIAASREILEQAAAERTEKAFRLIEAAVEEFTPDADKPKPTFRKVVSDLCDGTLHALHPDHIGARTEKGREAQRAQLATFFPVLGDKTFDEITRDDIDAAKLLIPKDVGQNTRVRYIRELRYVVNLAVEPLRLTEQVPVIRVPRSVDTDEFQLLYPDEEEKLAGATVAVSLEERFLYAFLARHGGRISETLQYTWEACDLERGRMRVAKAWTKTGKARFFDFEPDVLEALRLRRKMIPEATLMFLPPPLRVFTRTSVYHHLKPNLKAAGVTRPELHATPEGERPLTTHDFRGSFVTLARAIGMTDTWIRDRTGHEDPKTLQKYDRHVRHAIERKLGWWAPMGRALQMPGATVRSRLGLSLIPDVGRGLLGQAEVGQGWAKATQTPGKTGPGTFRCELSAGAQPTENRGNPGVGVSVSTPSAPSGPAQKPDVGQSPVAESERGGPKPSALQDTPLDPVAEALARVEQNLSDALLIAAKAGDASTVRILAKELEARRLAREAQQSSGVTDIASARRKREEKP